MAPGPGDSPTRILPAVRRTPDGWWICTIHYSALPTGAYDFEAACEGLTDEGVRRELEIDWSATEGRRVYPQFGRARHVALEPLVSDPKRPFYCGFDMPGCPAFSVTQINSYGQWLIFNGVYPSPEMGIGVYDFGNLCAEHLLRNHAAPHGLTLKDLELQFFGDPAGNSRPPRTGEKRQEMQSCFDILNRGLRIPLGVDEDYERVYEERPGLGWKIRPGAVNLTARLEAVRGRLTHSLRDGLPALVVCPENELLIRGFLGGYHYPVRPNGMYAYEPRKNYESHGMDSLAYVGTSLFSVGKKAVEDEDEVVTRAPEFRSGAASRYA